MHLLVSFIVPFLILFTISVFGQVGDEEKLVQPQSQTTRSENNNGMTLPQILPLKRRSREPKYGQPMFTPKTEENTRQSLKKSSTENGDAWRSFEQETSRSASSSDTLPSNGSDRERRRSFYYKSKKGPFLPPI